MANWTKIPEIFRKASAHLFKRKNLIIVNGKMDRTEQRTGAFHAFGHDITPWHSEPIFSCTSKAIELGVTRKVERDAFMCGAEMQMPSDLFIPDSLEPPLGFDSIEKLAIKYDALIETTAIQYIMKNRSICAIVVVEHLEEHIIKRPVSNRKSSNQLTFPFLRLHLRIPAQDADDYQLKVKYCVKSPRFPNYIRPGTGISEGSRIYESWDTGSVLHHELPASAFGLTTKEIYNAEIFPLEKTGMTMVLLWLPDRQSVLHPQWESIL